MSARREQQLEREVAELQERIAANQRTLLELAEQAPNILDTVMSALGRER